MTRLGHQQSGQGLAHQGFPGGGGGSPGIVIASKLIDFAGVSPQALAGSVNVDGVDVLFQGFGNGNHSVVDSGGGVGVLRWATTTGGGYTNLEILTAALTAALGTAPNPSTDTLRVGFKLASGISGSPLASKVFTIFPVAEAPDTSTHVREAGFLTTGAATVQKGVRDGASSYAMGVETPASDNAFSIEFGRGGFAARYAASGYPAASDEPFAVGPVGSLSTAILDTSDSSCPWNPSAAFKVVMQSTLWVSTVDIASIKLELLREA